MFGSKAAIRKYHQTLPLALSKRYGRAKQYTQGQVDTTIQVLNLNKRYALYAYILYCDIDELDPQLFNDNDIEEMKASITSALDGGLFAASIDSVFMSADSNEVGSGDGGSGGGE